MMRAVLWLLGAIIAITLLRGSIGLIMKGVQFVMKPTADPPNDPNTVDMVKCPSCGSIFAPGQAAAQQHQHQHRK